MSSSVDQHQAPHAVAARNPRRDLVAGALGADDVVVRGAARDLVGACRVLMVTHDVEEAVFLGQQVVVPASDRGPWPGSAPRHREQGK
jgi:ABC-type taurine transport system ATPase subunit